jgi:hypothetical protein
MSAEPQSWRALSETDKWRAAIIAAQFPIRPTDEALASIAAAVRALRKK